MNVICGYERTNGDEHFDTTMSYIGRGFKLVPTIFMPNESSLLTMTIVHKADFTRFCLQRKHFKCTIKCENKIDGSCNSDNSRTENLFAIFWEIF